ncbi:filamentous hemagglutinin N-terminal domain-containing protein [Cupriavidus basilensis]|uniref:Large exoproteins involved in heme utilization or adhesion n=1 Tax=Cupriavidus basilensis TaxID=68895 RepID=A0A0C4YA85_9BURK|nr:filamentous hemagglutinin N-terminal domain-containing protein [Cupriavidus basilensis]AJG19848.1 Large exoproteins involved in heme utilization or adhesion [Cupriavidus basilensis]
MNNNYALVWNQTQGCWNVASEGTRRRGKSGGARRVIAAAVALLGLGALAPAHALPTGNVIVSGTGNVASFNNGRDMSINQSSDKLIINWNGFSVGAGEKVFFNQPDSNAIALNRVVTANASNIQGQIDANGRVFLVNPNGIVFGQTAQVNVGGLVASTQDISNADFNSGTYRFAGSPGGSVTNAGRITAAAGGSVALLGRTVNNTGLVQAQMGRVALGAGNDFTVSFDAGNLLNLKVNDGVVGSLVQNGGLLKADGGQVLMTARAVGSLQEAVVNNTGMIEAKTLQGNAGKITLDGGSAGVVRVSGSLNASAMAGPGNGGTIETRGADVQVQLATQVNTQANNGQTGTWKLSAMDVNVGQTAASGEITAFGDTLSRNLATTNIELASTVGNLSVNAPISWNSGNKLTLASAGDVNVNAALSATGVNAGMAMTAAGANDINLNKNVTLSGAGNGLELNYGRALNLNSGAVVTLSGTGASFKSNGFSYNVIQNLAQLQGINDNLGGYYVLGNKISGGWFSGNSLKSIGGDYGTFYGVLDGLGNTLSNLSVTSTGPLSGLFSASSGRISNLGLAALTVNATSANTGAAALGALVGENSGTISNVTATGVRLNSYTGRAHTMGGLVGRNLASGSIDRASVSASSLSGGSLTQSIGGLVGENAGSVTRSTSDVSIGGFMQRTAMGGVGGLVGLNAGPNAYIADSSSRGTVGTVYGGLNVGGLVGYNNGGVIERAFSAGNTAASGNAVIGGLVGLNDGGGRIADASTSGRVNGSGAAAIGGLVGQNRNGSLTNVKTSSIVTDFWGVDMGGLAGSNEGGTIFSAEATGAVIGGANSRVGGLVGSNYSGTIQSSVARGKTSGGSNSHTGGLVGYNGGDLLAVEASGDVSAGANSFVGGLVGTNVATNGAVIASGVASGNVRGESRSVVGGLVGQNHGMVRASSASGTVSGGSYVTMGGLIGVNQGQVDYSTASGKVSFVPYYSQNYGGLVGVNFGRMQGNRVSGNAALVPLAGINYGTIVD